MAAGPDLHAFQRSEAQQQLLDAGLALKSHNAKVVGGAGGLAGDDDAFAEFRMADAVAGIKDLEGRSGVFVAEGSVEAGADSAAVRDRSTPKSSARSVHDADRQS